MNESNVVAPKQGQAKEQIYSSMSYMSEEELYSNYEHVFFWLSAIRTHDLEFMKKVNEARLEFMKFDKTFQVIFQEYYTRNPEEKLHALDRPSVIDQMKRSSQERPRL